jgi:ribokinase
MPVKKPRVVVVGGYNADLFVTCSQLPTAQKIFMGGPLQIFGGGRGANMAVAAARAGCEVSFVGGCGRDGFGGMARGLLSNERINLDFFAEIPNASTGTSLILVETSSGRNMTMVAESANARLTPELVYQAQSVIKSADLVFTELEVRSEAAWATMQLCEQFGVPLILDCSPCQRRIALPANRLLAVVVEDTELASVVGTSNRQEAITELLKAGCENVIVVEGNEQIAFSNRESLLEVPIEAPKIVDRCGAVESVSVWVGLGLLRKLPLQQVCQNAAAAMAYCLGHMGGQRGMPTEADILAVQALAERIATVPA